VIDEESTPFWHLAKFSSAPPATQVLGSPRRRERLDGRGSREVRDELSSEASVESLIADASGAAVVCAPAKVRPDPVAAEHRRATLRATSRRCQELGRRRQQRGRRIEFSAVLRESGDAFCVDAGIAGGRRRICPPAAIVPRPLYRGDTARQSAAPKCGVRQPGPGRSSAMRSNQRAFDVPGVVA